MNERETAAALRRLLEEEVARGRTRVWEATISTYLRSGTRPASGLPGAEATAPRVTVAAAPRVVGAPVAAPIDHEAESLLSDAPAVAAGVAMEPMAGDTLEEIAAEVRGCTRCGLHETRTQAVPGVGSGKSGIVFVGEAPGAEEDRRGEPFVGRAGELLTKILQAMDERALIPGVKIDRDSVYICNVLKSRPPENRNPLPHEVEACAPYLYRQLALLRPRVICCLGKFAAELLVGAKGTIASMRGKTFRFGAAKLLVTYHPAACLRNPSLKRPVWEDMQRLAAEYQSP